MKVVQVWECPKCQYRYDAPIPVSSVLCPNYHPGGKGQRGGHAELVLVEGEPPRSKRKKASSGTSQRT